MQDRHPSADRYLPLLLAALVLACFSRHLFGPSTLLNDDLGWLFYPLRHFTNQELWRGSLPLWDPYRFCGMPLVGNIESALFYPPNWLALLIPLPRFFAWMAAAHFWWAAWGSYRYCRALDLGPEASLMAAVTYGLGGAMVSTSYSAVHLYVAAWLPWMLYALERGSLSGCALCMGAQILAGSPQFLVYNSLTWGLLGLTLTGPRRGWRSTLACLVGGASLGALLGAVQLLPFVELIFHSTRLALANGHLSSQYQLVWGLGWLLPERDLSPALQPNQFLATSSLLLALLGAFRWRARPRMVGAFLLLAALTLLAASDFGPLEALLGVLVPGYSMFRAPVRWLGSLTLAVSVLGALGWEAVRPLLGQGAARRAVLGLCVLDVAILGALQLPLTAAQDMTSEPSGYMGVQAKCPPGLRGMFCPYLDHHYLNWGMVVGFPTCSGYGSVALGDYMQFVGYGALLPGPDGRLEARGRMLRMDEQKALTEASNTLPWPHLDPHFAQVMSLGISVWSASQESPAASAQPSAGLARFRMVHSFEVCPGREETYARLLAPGFDPARTVLLSETPAIAMEPAPGGIDQVECLSQEPNRLDLKVETSQNGLLVLSDTYYPGWTASLDGNPVTIQQAYWVFRAIPIPAGTHRVLVTYRPLCLRLGAGLSLLTLALLAWRLWRRRP